MLLMNRMKVAAGVETPIWTIRGKSQKGGVV
jgi:hypothetical protein